MSRFLKNATFPILIVVVLAFFAQRFLGQNESKPKPNFGQFLTQVKAGDVKSVTLNYLLRNLRGRDPRTLEVCALLVKPGRRKIDLPIKYVGFEIPNRYVVGYGLDLDQRYRNLPYVAAVQDALAARAVA